MSIDKIWEELGRQIEEHDIKIKKGKIQDASFIEAEPGKNQLRGKHLQ